VVGEIEVVAEVKRKPHRDDSATGLELEILETVRGQVPPEVFTTEYKNPVNGNPEAVRNNLREATRLLREAGLRDPQPETRQCQDRRTDDGRVSVR
jgi:ABC-type oligopeptide transport system substrate-binding subunit